MDPDRLPDMARVTRVEIMHEEHPSCVHHWVLDDPVGSTVSGRCRRCGGTREFGARLVGDDHLEDDRDRARSERRSASKAG